MHSTFEQYKVHVYIKLYMEQHQRKKWEFGDVLVSSLLKHVTKLHVAKISIPHFRQDFTLPSRLLQVRLDRDFAIPMYALPFPYILKSG